MLMRGMYVYANTERERERLCGGRIDIITVNDDRDVVGTGGEARSEADQLSRACCIV